MAASNASSLTGSSRLSSSSEETAPPGAAWLEISVQNPGAGCAFLDNFNLTDGASQGFTDLELTAAAEVDEPPIWTNFSVKFVLKNKSATDAPGEKVRLDAPQGFIYEGGNEFAFYAQCVRAWRAPDTYDWPDR